MDFNTLRYNLQQPYLQKNWKEWLLQLFGQQISIETQPEKIVVQKGNAISIERFASIALSDDKNIAVLSIRVSSEIQIARNRVALRDIVFKLIDQDKYHGLLVFYYNYKPEYESEKGIREEYVQPDYRMSFISSLTTIDADGNFITQNTHAKRYSFVLGSNESCTTATLRLLELRRKVPVFKAFETQKGISLKDLTDAFSVEALNNEFFKKYKDIHYKRFWEYIANTPEYATVLLNTEETELVKQQKPIRDFVKKMLGRIVFLHFLQKKGWMGCPANSEAWKDGDKNFMLNLFSNYPNHQHFYSKGLTVLFFKILNTDRRKKYDVMPKELHYKNPSVKSDLYRAPFLNGGLFDDDLPETNSFDFPIDYFKDLFDFFSQYNFTIDENSPEEQEVGIDPEMLGHIFENLLEENKDKGAFYTPKEIVHYMCQESLIQYLRTHLPECTEDESPATNAIETFIRKDDIGNRTDKKNFIVANAKRIEALLDKVKICDPAIGSGAFPMGMLQEIFKAKTTLDLTLDKAKVKKDIIRNNIYGVDLENGAVDIARLRFWLSLVVDEEIPQPLPNLDYKIMQGNSLLERFDDIDLSKVHTITKTTTIYEPQKDIFGNITNPQLKITDNTVLRDNDLQQLMSEFFVETDPVKKAEKKEQVNQTIHNHIDYNLELWQNAITIQIANAPKLSDPGIKQATKRKIEKLHSDLEALNNTRKRLHELENKTAKPYFLWHLLFADVFEEGGFDIVIGNPPYIQMQKDKGALAELLKNAGYETFERTGDVYAIFYELGFNVLKPNGVHTFITSSQWMKAGYGKSLRQLFLKKNPLRLVALGPGAFDTAVVDTNILIAKNSENGNQLLGAIITNKSQMANMNDLNFIHMAYVNDESWSILNPIEQKIKQTIIEKGKPLSDWDVKINFGIKTGYNEAFIIDEAKKNELIKEDDKSIEIIKPILRGREVEKYYTQWDGGYIIATFPALDINIDRYRAIKNYLNGFQPKLNQSGETFINSDGIEEKTRKKTGNKWFETQDQIGYYKELSKEKIIWKRIGSQLRFSYSNKEMYCLDSTCIATGEKIKYLTVLLNSKVCQYQLFESAPKTGMGDLIISVQALEPLFVYYPNKEEQEKIERLADYLIFLNDPSQPPINNFTDNLSIAPVFEDVANMMVYELYFKQHMQELEIDVLQFIDTDKHFKPIDTSETANKEANAKIIGDCYKWLQGQDNPIRNRIILSNIKSTDIIRKINASTH